MRTARALAVVLPLLCFVQSAQARNKHDWKNVENLKRNTPVSIWLWSGDNLKGRIVSVADARMLLNGTDPVDPAVAARPVQRNAIRRVVLIRGSALPDSGWIWVGTLGGGLAGMIAGAAEDGIHGSGGRWVVGSVTGMVAGFLGSCVILGTVGILRAARRSFHSATIYESTRPPAAS